jgi:hypothetical protein
MGHAVDWTLTVGDRQMPIRGELRFEDGTPEGSLAPLTAVTFKMVASTAGPTDPPKINDQPCVIEGPGLARYDWQAADVDTAGVYFIWFRDIDASGKAQHWPGKGRTYAIRFEHPK